MRHPYEQYENTAVWRALDAEIAALEANVDIRLTTSRPYIIGALCQRLARGNLVVEAALWPPEQARASFVAFLDRAAAADVPATSEWLEQVATRYPDGEVESARVDAVLLLFRQQRGEVTTEQFTTGLLEIARRLRDHAI